MPMTIPPIVTPVSIANGGTNSTTAPGALTNLGAAALAGNSSQVFSAANGSSANNVSTIGQTIGVTQTWTNELSNRAVGTTYTNTESTPIMVSVSCYPAGVDGTTYMTINSISIFGTSAFSTSALTTVCVIVPPGATYLANCTGGTPTLQQWLELR